VSEFADDSPCHIGVVTRCRVLPFSLGSAALKPRVGRLGDRHFGRRSEGTSAVVLLVVRSDQVLHLAIGGPRVEEPVSHAATSLDPVADALSSRMGVRMTYFDEPRSAKASHHLATFAVAPLREEDWSLGAISDDETSGSGRRFASLGHSYSRSGSAGETFSPVVGSCAAVYQRLPTSVYHCVYQPSLTEPKPTLRRTTTWSQKEAAWEVLRGLRSRCRKAWGFKSLRPHHCLLLAFCVARFGFCPRFGERLPDASTAWVDKRTPRRIPGTVMLWFRGVACRKCNSALRPNWVAPGPSCRDSAAVLHRTTTQWFRLA